MKYHELDINHDLITRARFYVKKSGFRSKHCVIAQAIKEQVGLESVSIGSRAIGYYDNDGHKNSTILLGKVARQVRDAFDENIRIEPCKVWIYVE